MPRYVPVSFLSLEQGKFSTLWIVLAQEEKERKGTGDEDTIRKGTLVKRGEIETEMRGKFIRSLLSFPFGGKSLILLVSPEQLRLGEEVRQATPRATDPEPMKTF